MRNAYIISISIAKKGADREKWTRKNIFISIYFVHPRKIYVHSAIKFFIEYFRGQTSHSVKSLFRKLFRRLEFYIRKRGTREYRERINCPALASRCQYKLEPNHKVKTTQRYWAVGQNVALILPDISFSSKFPSAIQSKAWYLRTNWIVSRQGIVHLDCRQLD